MSDLVTGDKQLERKLARLPDRVLNRVVRRASAKAMIPVSRSAKANAPRETGLLAKSIGRKTKVFKSGGTVQTVVGPRLGFKQMVTLPNGKTMLRNPFKYAHLVEFGTRHSAAKPFMRPALESNKGAIIAVYRSELASGVVREAVRA